MMEEQKRKVIGPRDTKKCSESGPRAVQNLGRARESARKWRNARATINHVSVVNISTSSSTHLTLPTIPSISSTTMPATRNRGSRAASVNATAGPSSATGAPSRGRTAGPAAAAAAIRPSRNTPPASLTLDTHTSDAPETISFSISDDGNPDADISDVFAAPSASATFAPDAQASWQQEPQQHAGPSAPSATTTHTPIDASLLYAPVGAHLLEPASTAQTEQAEEDSLARVRFVEASSSASPPSAQVYRGDVAAYDASQSGSMDQGASWIEDDSRATGDTTQDHEASHARPRPKLNFAAPGRSARLFLGLESSRHKARTVRNLSPAADRASVMSLPLDPYAQAKASTSSASDAFAPAVARGPAATALDRQHDVRRKLPSYAAARLEQRNREEREGRPRIVTARHDEATPTHIAYVGCANKAVCAADQACNSLRRKRTKLFDSVAQAAAKKPATSKAMARRDDTLLSLWDEAGVEKMIRCEKVMRKAETKLNDSE